MNKTPKETSLNIGIAACTALFLLFVKDGLKLFINKDLLMEIDALIEGIYALIVLCLPVLVLASNVGARVKHKRRFQEAVNFCAAVSILMIPIDGVLMRCMQGVIDRVVMGILLFLLSFVSAGVFICKLYYNKTE